MVFRRDNKVDQFQNQMKSLRQQIGGAAADRPQEDDAPIPDLEDERFPREAYAPPPNPREQDAGGYSFGSFPAQTAPEQTPVAAPTAPEVPHIPASDSQVSVVATATVWKGELESEGSMHIYGRVEGALRAREDIGLAAGSEVNATVQARRVIAGGTVTGSIRAIDRFEALPQCQVNADVQAPVFVVHEGASISGQLKMGSGDGGSGESRTDRSGSPAIIQRRARTGA